MIYLNKILSKIKLNEFDYEYHSLIYDILSNGKNKEDRTGTGTKSVFGRQLRFDVSNDFPLLTTKKVWYKGVLHELLWFLNAMPEEYTKFGNTNIKYLVDNNVNIWNEWAYESASKEAEKEGKEFVCQNAFVNLVKTNDDLAKRYGELGPVYGKQWVDFNGVNQIKSLTNSLIENPFSRRHILSAWNPSEVPDMALPPCHKGFQLYVDECSVTNTKYLSLKWEQRSVDVFLGLPFNIASYATLLYMFSKVTGYKPKELICDLGDVHIYNNHLDAVKTQLKRGSYDPPKLFISDRKVDGEYISDLSDFRYEDFSLINYKSKPSIKAPIAV